MYATQFIDDVIMFSDFTAQAPSSVYAEIRSEAQLVWGVRRERSPWQSVATYIIIVLAGLSILKEVRYNNNFVIKNCTEGYFIFSPLLNLEVPVRVI